MVQTWTGYLSTLFQILCLSYFNIEWLSFHNISIFVHLQYLCFLRRISPTYLLHYPFHQINLYNPINIKWSYQSYTIFPYCFSNSFTLKYLVDCWDILIWLPIFRMYLVVLYALCRGLVLLQRTIPIYLSADQQY